MKFRNFARRPTSSEFGRLLLKDAQLDAMLLFSLIIYDHQVVNSNHISSAELESVGC